MSPPKPKTRVFRKDDKSIPKDAPYISGTNETVNKMNNLKLCQVEGKEIELKASVFSDTRGEFTPSLDKKLDIRGTTLQYKLCIKKGCRVMLTTNLDVCDGLTNGSQGLVVDFEHNKAGKIKYIMVKFDSKESGQERRKKFKSEEKYAGKDLTPIEILERTFSLSKKQTSASSTATALQFPLRLAYAATAHKIQGHTIKKPQSLVVDLVTWLQPAMGYVMLSRIETLSQLYIVGSIPKDKLKPWPSALEELERMNNIALNRDNIQDLRFKLCSLNTLSLRKHIIDIKGDYGLVKSNVICLQETWLGLDEETNDLYQLPDLNAHFVSQGRGKGIVTFFSDMFVPVKDINDPLFQMSKIVSSKISIINVYRSEKAGSKFLEELESLISFDRTLIICGDFNYCYRDQQNHPVKELLKDLNFNQVVQEATHREGRILDHVYIFFKEPLNSTTVECRVTGCYYSDHDKVTTLVNIE